MWPRPPVTDRRDPDGHHTRIGYIMRRHGFERHCGIVTRVCLAAGGRSGEPATVITASRDATLKCWDVPAAAEARGGASSSSAPAPAAPAALRCSLEEHGGWVNDCVVLPPLAGQPRGSRRVVSCSNDHFVKLWHLDGERQGAGVAASLLSLRYHIDYVTCLAYAPRRSLLASGGLDGRAAVADLEAATRVLTLGGDAAESGGGGGGMGPGARGFGAPHCAVGHFSGSGQYIPLLVAPPGAQAPGHDRGAPVEQDAAAAGPSGASIWSMAMTHSGSLLACGTASCAVRGWDPRSGQRLWRLRGHTENVRALLLSEDGALCVSASSDRTVRVWDIGMRRCLHAFDAHHDSVWALAVAGRSCGFATQVADGGAGGALREVFSGGRDGLVLRHDLRQLQTALVVREASAVQALAVPPDGGEVWSSAADSHVRRPPGAAPLSPVPALPPPASDDLVAILGAPRLTAFRVLDNKRQVLVRDACEQLALWDVTSGQCQDLPAPEPAPAKEASGPLGASTAEEVMKRAFALVNRPVSVPSWFTCDIALGSLSVYLDVSQCFKAEPDEADVLPVQAVAGTARSPPPARLEGSGAVNLGARTLRALFDSWVRVPPATLTASGGRVSDRGGSRSPSPSTRRGAPAPRPRIFAAPPAPPEDRSWGDGQPPGTPSRGAAAEPPPGGLPTFPPATALVMVSRSGRPVGYRGRLYCGYFNASESPELLPPWVVEVVWNQRSPPEELRGERSLAFSLARCPTERALPLLSCPFCAAPPRTRVRRLMAHLVKTLDFDWAAPARAVPRRPSSAVSLVTRLGRCCVAPGGRGARGSSSDSWEDSDRGEAPTPRRGRAEGGPAGARGGGGSRSASRKGRGSRERAAQPTAAGRSRGFNLRGRGEDDGSGPVGAVARVRIDASPPRAPDAAPSTPPRRGAGAAAATPEKGATGLGAAALAPEDCERCVEIVCNGVVCAPDMSLATVRDFLWKKPGAELLLSYRRAAGRRDCALPSPVSCEDSELVSSGGATAWGSPQTETPGPSPGDGLRSPGTAPKE